MHQYINILGFVISSYSFMALMGVLFSVIYIFFISVKKCLDYRENVIFMIFGVPFAFVGAFLLNIITQIKSIPSSFSLGFVFYGGLIGFLFGQSFYAKLSKTDCRKKLQFLTPAIPLFHGFGRIGCFLAGCCYGKSGIPVQLIESGFNFILFVVLFLISVKCKKSFMPLGVYFTAYGIMRFFIEFFRGDEIRGFLLGLSTSQWISLIIIPLGIYNLIVNEEKNHFNKWFYQQS